MKPNIIAIIPARGGSKGIPRKNIRLMCGKPLIAHTIAAALDSKYISKVVVSTDDEEILEISRIYCAEVILRPKELAQDDITLDPVIYHAVEAIEKTEKMKYDFVVTIQPTSPLLSKETIDKALNIMITNNYDTLISVIRENHLYWRIDGAAYVPLYKERKNRQQLEPLYREAGAILICRREVMIEESRIGKNVYLFEIPAKEAIDIDDYNDWIVAENSLRKLKIIFRAEGDERIGLGHIYRVITLANRICAHEIFFLTDKSKILGFSKLKEYNYPVLTYGNQDELINKVAEIKPDIIVNDILDTQKDYICNLNNMGLFVVNFEDLGEGSEYAALVVNALYENSYPPQNHYYGYKYECLRDEFSLFHPRDISNDVKNLLITFGGVDENNLTRRTLNAIEKIGLKNIYVTVILGIGYPFNKELRIIVDDLNEKGFRIELKKDVKIMAKYIANSDLAITSNGRTLYEVASLGIPCISICQNEREVKHLFPQICKGIINLGIAFSVSEDIIASALARVIGDYQLRKEMHENMLKFDLKNDTVRTLRLIFDRYWEWKENEVR